jgi:hypothetical protein
MRFLRGLVFENLGLKLSALALALILWVAYTAEPFAEAAYNVPLVLLNLPAGVEVAGDVPTTVRVRVRARAALLRKLAPADLNFTVDLGGAHAGDTPIALTPEMVDVPYGTEVVRITPADLQISLIASSTLSPSRSK